MIKLYGIPNCDTVKKAKKWLVEKSISFEFINFKVDAPTVILLEKCKEKNGDWPVNTRGRTYREFKDDYLSSNTEDKIKLMIKESSIIKRPILEIDDEVACVGFDNKLYDQLL